MTIEELNSDSKRAKKELMKCCGSDKWAEKVLEGLPFTSVDSLMTLSDKAWKECSTDDFLEAFSHHPRIGEKNISSEKLAETSAWAAGEQAGVDDTDRALNDELLQLNKDYEEKFGFIFIVCATGKSGKEMLRLLKNRIINDRQSEIEIAAAEQNKITNIRLRKLFS